MRVSLIKSKQMLDIILPIRVEGSYWVSDVENNGNKKNLISIEPNENVWRLVGNKEIQCIENNTIVPYFDLCNYHFYTLENVIDKKRFLVYCSPVKEDYLYYNVTNFLEKGIVVGNGKKVTIAYQLLDDNSAIIKQENGKFYIIDNKCKYGVFVNKVRVRGRKELKTGDIVFIAGLKMYLAIQSLKGNDNIYLAVNNRNLSSILVNGLVPNNLFYQKVEFVESEEELEFSLYEEDDYFHRIPRYINSLKEVDVHIDAPPGKVEEQEKSALLTIGPMITMSMTTLLTGYNSINNLMTGTVTFKQAMPSLIMCGAMVASVFIWPTFTRRYQKKQRKKKEKLRQKKYSAYIEEKKALIIDTKRKQAEILKNSFPDTKYCEEVILNKYTNLWQKRIEDEDYLKINLGTGDVPAAIKIQYPQEHFSLYEDNLKELVYKVGNEPRVLTGVPIVLSLIENYICGIIGEEASINEYVKKLIIQILAFHSYEDLKIVILTDEEKAHYWEFLKDCPHCFTDDKNLRFFATNNDEYKEVCYYLGRVFNNRTENMKNNVNIKDMDKIFLVITDSFKKIRDYDIVDNILENKENYGFNIMILDRKMINLPEQCKTFVEIINDTGSLHSNENFVEGIKFSVNITDDIEFEKCAQVLSNIPIEIDSDDEGQLPQKIGFLEMYDVGKVEQLNSAFRWKNNNPILNLGVPVGVGKSGEMINIDLHEKYHGPHGLIAGMTGSGKSEFIISYILSMAVNYHPYEVQFVLIDYKGGGLAGAFENQSIGLKLPHLVGTITNLDANEINRSLASIESELKRRQAVFNKAREISGESTIDIYKYQRMYRDGKIDEPVSHLFIISDEFAELKSQQPDFMAQLISTARIGRSLGVHLILATQKPSGVVDSQIWSNSRFRVCLRVQEKSDSNEVIKCPDAALLKQTGRFYFQVGYNEIFVLGQASWAGGKYFPEEKVKKTVDTTINFIDNIGYVIKNVDTKPKQAAVQAQGEELINIVKYLDALGKDQNIKCRPLWLEKIPAYIKIENLAEKYDFKKEEFVINPIVGEYDIPTKQEQALLTLPISAEGNSLIYGTTGSGKENFVTTLIYSSALYYLPNEVNYYVVDFGSGALKMFQDYSIVGDIINSDDDEKISNLYKMLNKEMQIRKDLFEDYNGSYLNYCKNSNSSVPTIVVIINNYEAYYEAYSNNEDDLVVLTREGSKYGIYFVLMVNTPNGVRFKVRQNFGVIYSLQQNNDDDYVSILGNVRKKYPSRIFGRGIMKVGNSVHEFQTATVSEPDNISDFIKNKGKEIAQKYPERAVKVPVLPKTVVYKELVDGEVPDDIFVVGINKNSLQPVLYNYKKKFSTVIAANELNQLTPFVNPLICQFVHNKKERLIVINSEDCPVDLKFRNNYEYIDTNFDKYFNELFDLVTKQNDIYTESNFEKSSLKDEEKICCIIIGIEVFKNKLNDDNEKRFGDLFVKAKDLGTISFILVDSVYKFKKFEYESWYKNSVDGTSSIWLGNGISEQSIVKTNQRLEEMRKEVPYNFCFVVNNGRPEYVKFIEKYECQEDVNEENREELVEQIDEIDI